MQGCRICNHDRRREIEQAVYARVDVAEICHLFEVAAGEVWHHITHGDPAAEEAPLADRNRTFFQHISDAVSAAEEEAGQGGSTRSRLAAVQRTESLIALAHKVDKEQAARAYEPEAFTQHPLWLDLKARILRALEAYPDAYRALLEALDV